MRIKYLGTGAAEGIPALFCGCGNCRQARKLGGKNIRTRSQALINEDLLVDFGPDTYMHALRYGIDLLKIRDVVITHCHQDHFYIDDLLARAYPFGNAADVLHVYGNDRMKEIYQYKVRKDNLGENVDRVLEAAELYKGQEYRIGNYGLTPLAADHNMGENCFIYSISGENKSILYANDTGFFPEETWNALEGKYFDLVSLDCNHIEEPVYQNHMSIACCVEVRDRLMSMGCMDGKSICVLTHFSHNHGGLQEKLEKLVKDLDMVIAYDGLEIEL